MPDHDKLPVADTSASSQPLKTLVGVQKQTGKSNFTEGHQCDTILNKGKESVPFT
jgi:hypothetical protein